MLVCFELAHAQVPLEWQHCATGPCDCHYEDNEVECHNVPIIDIYIWQFFPPNLRRLELWNNEIETFPPNFFSIKNLHTLIDLELRSNPLTELVADDFLTLPFLEILTIQWSDLTGFPDDLLMHLRNLKTLDLLFNRQLTRLPDSLLLGLYNLTFFRLQSSNLITEIPKRFFLATPNIELVWFYYLDGLTSDDIPYDFLHSTNTVHNIRFIGNSNLTVIKNTWFKNLGYPGNVGLFLSNNGFQSIEEGAFDGVPNVNYIGLFDNDLSLEGFPDNLFDNVVADGKHIMVYMQRNPRLTTMPPACLIAGVTCVLE